MRSSALTAITAALCLLSCESSPERPPSMPGTRADAGGGGDTGVVQDGAIADAESDAGIIDSGGDGGVSDGGARISIPDPGTAMDDWGLSVVDACCSTPDTAYPTGVVTMDSGYVQGNIDPSTGDFFYVFRAGPALTTLTFTGFLTLDILDLHDGTGLVFGSVVPPTTTGQNTATWPVAPNQVYVLHLHSPNSGFF